VPQDRTTLWLLVAVGTLTIIYAVIRPMFRRKDPLQKPPAYASLSRQRAVEREMQNVLVELAEMARQITAQLDSRATKLELLIKDADQRIAQLKESPAPAAPSPLQENPPAPPEPMDASPPDPRYAEIYAMADQGRSAREIAEQLNRPSGEVELILALRR
jgi:hypothetical protein